MKVLDLLNEIKGNTFHIHSVKSRTYLIEDLCNNEDNYEYYCHCVCSERRVKKYIQKLLKASL